MEEGRRSLGAFSLFWSLGLIRSGGDSGPRSGEVVVPDSAPGEPEIVGGGIGEMTLAQARFFSHVFFGRGDGTVGLGLL